MILAMCGAGILFGECLLGGKGGKRTVMVGGRLEKGGVFFLLEGTGGRQGCRCELFGWGLQEAKWNWIEMFGCRRMGGRSVTGVWDKVCRKSGCM